MSTQESHPVADRTDRRTLPRIGTIGAAVLSLLIVAAWASSAAATVYVVETTCPNASDLNDGLTDCSHYQAPFHGPKKTIQAAINAAAAKGDTVIVFSGVYSGPGNVNLDTLGKEIWLIGDHKGAVIDCGGTAQGFLIHSGEGGGTKISEFTIKNCSTIGFPTPVWGIDIIGASPTISNCDSEGLHISNGSPYVEGFTDLGHGTAIDTGSKPNFFACNFYNSTSYGLTALDSQVSMSWCTAIGCAERALIINYADLQASDCKFNANIGPGAGGVMLLSATATLTDCEVIGNEDWHATAKGGGIAVYGGQLTLVRCKILNNTIGKNYSGKGGGLYLAEKSTLVDCVIEGNTAYDHLGTGSAGGGIYAEGEVTYSGCTIRNNIAKSGGAGIAAFGPQTFKNCFISGHTTRYGGAGVTLGPSAPASFVDCEFANNTSTDDGNGVGAAGGAILTAGAKTTFERCKFKNNSCEGVSASQGGGAVRSPGGAAFDNCLFSGNKDTKSGHGGALNLGAVGSTGQVVNCTFYGNSVTAGTAGALAADATVPVTSSIFWGNGNTPVVGPSAVNYCDVEDAPGVLYAGTGNMNVDPLFVNPGALDFRLQHQNGLGGSPCFDAGDTFAIPSGVTVDHQFNPRRSSVYWAPDVGTGSPPIVDMGALEFCGMESVPGPAGVMGGVSPGGGFGTVVEVHLTVKCCRAAGDDKVMVVGAFGADEATVHVPDAHGNWTLQGSLIPPDGQSGDYYGVSVAIDGDLIAVGAPRHDQGGSNAGAVYLFRQVGDQWFFESKLLAPDGAPGAQFGFSVAVSGDRVLVGAWRADPDGQADAGEAYVFHLDGQQWTCESTLVAPDPTPSAAFGRAVKLWDDTAVVGAPGAMDGSGLVYVFRRAENQWYREATLTNPQPVAEDRFGAALDLWGNRLVVGTPGRDLPGMTDAGAAYLFLGLFGQWIPDGELTSASPSEGALFGSSVTVQGELAAAGSPGAFEGVGQASLFTRGVEQWEEAAVVSAENGAPGDNFGRSVSIGVDTLVAGAPGHDGPDGEDQGAVYPFALSEAPCYADFTGDGALDLFDFLGYVNAFNEGDGHADCDSNGGLDLFDFLCFVNGFNTGC